MFLDYFLNLYIRHVRRMRRII